MADAPQIKLEYGEHRQQQVVFIRFAYNRHLVDDLRNTLPVRWSRTQGCWYAVKGKFDLNMFFNQFKGKIWIDYLAIKFKEHTPPRQLKPPGKPSDKLNSVKAQLSPSVSAQIHA
ncbi:MAG: hypothetical protein ACK5HT_00220, partial [Draconibacterium sp.]